MTNNIILLSLREQYDWNIFLESCFPAIRHVSLVRLVCYSDELESLSSFGHCAHFTFDDLCNLMQSLSYFCDVS